MHMTDIPPVDLLLAGCGTLMVCAFALAAITFDGWRRATRRQSQHLFSHSESLLQQLTALDARVSATATAIRRLDDRIERHKPTVTPQVQQAPAAGPGYQVAIRMARSGATREEIMSSCGLSFPEAELVRRVHAATARTAHGVRA